MTCIMPRNVTITLRSLTNQPQHALHEVDDGLGLFRLSGEVKDSSEVGLGVVDVVIDRGSLMATWNVGAE